MAPFINAPHPLLTPSQFEMCAAIPNVVHIGMLFQLDLTPFVTVMSSFNFRRPDIWLMQLLSCVPRDTIEPPTLNKSFYRLRHVTTAVHSPRRFESHVFDTSLRAINQRLYNSNLYSSGNDFTIHNNEHLLSWFSYFHMNTNNTELNDRKNFVIPGNLPGISAAGDEHALRSDVFYFLLVVS